MTVSIHDLLWLYLFAINGIAFVTMGMDKRKARKGKWRVPERVLFTQAALGGSIGALAGMYCFRHKTRHKKFVVGMPAILVVQIGIIFVVFFGNMK